MAISKRGLRLHVLSILALLLGIAASVVTFTLTGDSVRHTNQLLLRQQATQASMVLGSVVGTASDSVRDVAEAIPADGAAPSAWQTEAQGVAARQGYAGMAALRVRSGHFALLAQVGVIHDPFGSSADRAAASALTAGQNSYLGMVASGAKRWVTEIFAAPNSPGHAVYTETPVSMKPVSLASLPGHPFAGVEGAVYAGADIPADLVFRTSTHVPQRGQRAVAVISDSSLATAPGVVLTNRSGSLSAPGKLVEAIWPTSNLAGGAAGLLPWILVSVELAGAVLVAGLLEVSERRRDRVVASMRDLKRQEADLRRARALKERTDARFVAMVRHSSDLTTVVSRSGAISYQSASSTAMLGLDPDDVVGRPWSEILQSAERPIWDRVLAQACQEPGSHVQCQWRLVRADGGHIDVDARVTNLLDDPAVAGIVINSRDITDQKRLEAQLRHQAFHDAVTELPNRVLLEDRLEQALGRLTRVGGVLGVLFLDLDDFKAVNDGRGHNVGDELLRAVADRLRGTLRPGDTLARIGGDEFAILVESDSDPAAYGAAERIRDALKDPFELDSGPATVRASIGVTTTRGLSTAQDLLRDADIAMYAAKSGGKGRIEVFHPGLHDEVINRLQLALDLGRALDNDELAIFYQPLVEVSTAEVVGLEALMRWRHPHRGLVGPDQFIPIAESTGLIIPMGSWLLHQACHDLRRIQEDTGRSDLHLSVNVSIKQLDDPGLVHDVVRALGESGLSPDHLTLEITESVLMLHPERSLAVLQSLKDLGVRLSIDDFGTGYSSLAYLQRLPVDELKIDRSFVMASEESNESASLIHTIVSIAHDFGLQTVAEGIETESQLWNVRLAGCARAQGFLFAGPVEAAEVGEAIRATGALRLDSGRLSALR